MANFNINEIKRRNLLRIIETKGIKPNQLAELMKVKPPYITALTRGTRNLGERTLRKICKVLEISESEFYIPTERETMPERQGKPIPVISWIHAGHFIECMDVWPMGVSGEGEPVFARKKASQSAFALRVQGDSMSPRYLEGDIIVVDPCLRCADGSPGVAWLNGDVTFKLIRETDTEIILTALNDKYPTIVIKKDSKADFRIIGRVIDMIPKM